MAKIDDCLKDIFGQAVNATKDEVRALIKNAKADNSEFIKKQGRALERYITALAQKKINKKEFEDLVKGLSSLHKIELRRQSAAVKARAQALSEKMTDIVLESMIKMI